MKATSRGMGVVSFDEVFDVDKPLLYDFMSWLDEEREETFRYVENGTIALNQTGFKFDASEVNRAPGRYLDLRGERSGRIPEQRFVEFVDSLEKIVYDVFVQYCMIFPDAATTSWWRPAGHIATYEAGQEIGPHCDDQVPYEWGERPPNQVSMHNSTSINLYLNSHGVDFAGGEINFPHAGYTHTPVAGSAVAYPSNYVGRHEVLPVTSGLRICFLTMACYGVSHEYETEYVGMPMGNGRYWMPNLASDLMRAQSSH
jgi:hypothetical protein